MNQRLTRKEIKRDEFAEWLGRSADYVGSHRHAIVLVAVAIVGTIVLAAAAVLWAGQRREKANELLTRALAVYRAPISADSPQPDDPDAPSFADEASRSARAGELFEELAGYNFVGAASVADVYLGRMAADAGDHERARELWRDFVDDHGDHLLAGEVRLNLIALDRQQGLAEQVVAELEGMLERAPDDRPLPGDVVLYQLAQTYDQIGRVDEARSTYARLVEEYPQSAYGAAARQKAGPDATAQAQALAGLGS